VRLEIVSGSGGASDARGVSRPGTSLVGFQHRRIGLDGNHNVLVAVALARLADRQWAWYPPFPSPKRKNRGSFASPLTVCAR